MQFSWRSSVAIVVGGMVLVAGAPSGSAAATPARVKATNKSVAAVFLKHMDTFRTPGLVGPLRGRGNGSAAAEVRYGVNGESANPGKTIDTRVAVFRHRPPFVNRHFCMSGEGLRADGCRTRTLDDGSTLIVYWDRVEPEEDPGFVGLIRLDKGRACSAAYYSGTDIKGDPAQRGLSNHVVTFERLRAVVKDLRLSWRTTQHMVDVGASIPHWGEELRP